LLPEQAAQVETTEADLSNLVARNAIKRPRTDGETEQPGRGGHVALGPDRAMVQPPIHLGPLDLQTPETALVQAHGSSYDSVLEIPSGRMQPDGAIEIGARLLRQKAGKIKVLKAESPD
jgi:hypothetical protein